VQEEAGRVIYEGADVEVIGQLSKERLLVDIFGGNPAQLDQAAILQALLDCPRKFDGLYFRAEIVSDT